jgi:hypothetical protein
MATDKAHIFLSAVTGEFGQTRDELAADLRADSLEVKVRSDFHQEAEDPQICSHRKHPGVTSELMPNHQHDGGTFARQRLQ